MSLRHELRASHYSFFWLLIYKDAINSILNNPVPLEEVSALVLKHIDSEAKHLPIKAIFKSSIGSEFTDNIQCFTSFQPVFDTSANLFSLIVPAPAGDSRPPFKSDIFENFMEPQIIVKAKSRGYLDYKIVLFGNNQSNPLSFKINVKNEGYGFLCSPPGNWGK